MNILDYDAHAKEILGSAKIPKPPLPSNLDIKGEGKRTGTTTVGLVCKDAVILASDKRATMGYLIASKDIDKIYPITDHIGMTVAGGVGDAQTLVRWMQAELKLYQLRHDSPITVRGAATFLANVLSQYKFFPFFVQLLLGGYDKHPHLYSLDMLGGVTEEKFTATGSGSPIAYGVLEEHYDEKGSIEKNMKIAAKAVYAAMQRDAATGENVDVVLITKDGYQKLKRDRVKKLIGSKI